MLLYSITLRDLPQFSLFFSLLLLQLYFRMVMSVLRGHPGRLGDREHLLLSPITWNAYLPFLLLFPQRQATDFPFSLDLLNLGDTRFPVKPFEAVFFHSNGSHLSVNGEWDPIDLILRRRACVHYENCSSEMLLLYFT